MLTLDLAENDSRINPEDGGVRDDSVSPDNGDKSVDTIKSELAGRVRKAAEAADATGLRTRLLRQYDDVTAALELLEEGCTERLDFPSKGAVEHLLASLDEEQLKIIGGFDDPQLIIVPPKTMEELEHDVEGVDARTGLVLSNDGVNNRGRGDWEVSVTEGGRAKRAMIVKNPTAEKIVNKASAMVKKGMGCLEADEFCMLMLKKSLTASTEDDPWFGSRNPDAILNAEYLGTGDKRVSGGSAPVMMIRLSRYDISEKGRSFVAGVFGPEGGFIVPIIRLNSK